MEFQTSVDVANRALQHCGAEMIDAALGFTEVSKSARQTSFAYPKLRRAELQRNVWTCATRRTALRAIDTNTRLLSPSLWVETTTYFVGSLVSDENNNIWISRVPNNLGNQPQNSNTWEPYFGPLTVSLFDSTTTYISGELVYTTAGDGTYRVYTSLQSDNADVPGTATAWAATSVYIKNQVVTYLSVAYMSLIDFNTNQTPTASAANWAVGTTYAINNLVNGSDGVTYKSLANGNVGNDPTLTPASWVSQNILTPWTTVFTGGTGSLKWLEIGGSEFPFGVGLSGLNITYPVGAGPSSQSTTRNVYRLPNGFLRRAAQNPKAGAVSALGAPGGDSFNDWVIENNFLVTASTDVIIFRFVADVTDVSRLDDMFCELLAARLALEICEPLTQSTSKIQTIGKVYEKFAGEARTVNAIEVGWEDSPLDDYIACRA